MSKFISTINELMHGGDKESDSQKIARIRKKVQDDPNNASDNEKEIAKLADDEEERLKKKLSEAEHDEFVPRQGPDTGGEFKPKSKDDLTQEPSAEPTPDPMTPEGETFYVNLARKALFVDLDNSPLTDAEREVVTQDVQPSNAKEVAKILRKIVVDYGLGESFDSKIDNVWEDLELKDLRSKLSLEVKKNSIALVPGSFKPPHKGHYAMIEHFANIADEAIVVISDPQRETSIRRTPAGKQVTSQQARQILEIYTRKLGSTVKLVTSSQPVKWVYDYVAEDTVAGQNILLGVSGKGDDANRYVGAQKYAPEGVNVEASVFTDSDLNISASDFRNIIDNPSIEKLTPYIPNHLTESEIQEVLDVLLNLTERLS